MYQTSDIRTKELPVLQDCAVWNADALICASLAKPQVHAREVLHHDHRTGAMGSLTRLGVPASLCI